MNVTQERKYMKGKNMFLNCSADVIEEYIVLYGA